MNAAQQVPATGYIVTVRGIGRYATYAFSSGPAAYEYAEREEKAGYSVSIATVRGAK